MKWIVAVIITTIGCKVAMSQTCGALNFSTQVAVDAFPSTYPGCYAVTNLSISGSDIRNLDSLAQIDSIYSSLWLNGADKLNDISGLNSLKYVGYNFSISSCDSLTTIAVPNLNNVGGSFNLHNNQGLTTLQSLTNLNYIGEHFLLTSNDNLVTLNGLNSINYIGDVISINNNAALSDIMRLRLTDFNAITSLQISNNPALNNCDISTICDFIDLSTSCNITIFSNGAGCNTPGLVAQDCNLSVCNETVVKVGCGGTIWGSPNGWDDRIIPTACSDVLIPDAQNVIANVDVCIHTFEIELGATFETQSGKEFVVSGPDSCDP